MLLSSAALAKDFPVTDADQGNIAGICQIAARAPNVDIAVTANIAAWCVNWQSRVKAAAEAKDEPKAEKPKK